MSTTRVITAASIGLAALGLTGHFMLHELRFPHIHPFLLPLCVCKSLVPQ